jgi:hypothetical protein
LRVEKRSQVASQEDKELLPAKKHGAQTVQNISAEPDKVRRLAWRILAIAGEGRKGQIIPSKMASREVIKRIAGEIFGRAEVELYGKNPHKWMKKDLVGIHVARYYPESIDKQARKVRTVTIV